MQVSKWGHEGPLGLRFFSMQPLLFHDSLNLFSLVCNWTPLIYMHEGCIILREVLWSKKKKKRGGPWAGVQGKLGESNLRSDIASLERASWSCCAVLGKLWAAGLDPGSEASLPNQSLQWPQLPGEVLLCVWGSKQLDCLGSFAHWHLINWLIIADRAFGVMA